MWFTRFCLLTGLCWAFTSAAQSLDAQSQRRDASIFMLGEIHDNPDGHSRRLDRVMQLMGQAHQPVVVMEQFDREQQPALDLALAECKDVDCVLAKAATPGWDWRFYKPFVQLALDRKIKLVAANLSTADVRKVMTGGFSAVYSPQLIGEYKLSQIPAQVLHAQQQAIQEGHCNMLPPQAIAPMVQGQIARDVWMASVINALKNQTVVLIAGNGHVRKDAGVFQWLTPQAQRQTQVHGYVEKAQASDAAWFDHVHVVKPFEREDPCLMFTKKPNQK